MKTLLEQVNEIDALIRLMRKMESKLRSGQIIDAWRENQRIVAFLERSKQHIIAGTKKELPKLGDSDGE